MSDVVAGVIAMLTSPWIAGELASPPNSIPVPLSLVSAPVPGPAWLPVPFAQLQPAEPAMAATRRRVALSERRIGLAALAAWAVWIL